MRIAFVGDSITLGTGDREMLGWPGRICAAASTVGQVVTCYNLGVRGDTSDEIRLRWFEEAKRRLPKGDSCRLVFAFGLNDCVLRDGATLRVEPNRSKENAAVILGQAKSWLPTVVVGPAPVDDNREPPQPIGGPRLKIFNRQIDVVNNLIRVVAEELQLPYLDFFERLHCEPEWERIMQLGDSVHPTEAGYKRLAAIVETWPDWQSLILQP